MFDCQTMLPSVTQLLESSQHLAITWLRWEVAGRPASWLPCPFAPEAAGAGEMGVAQTFSWHVLPKVSFQERKRRDRTDHWFPLLTYCTTKNVVELGISTIFCWAFSQATTKLVCWVRAFAGPLSQGWMGAGPVANWLYKTALRKFAHVFYVLSFLLLNLPFCCCKFKLVRVYKLGTKMQAYNILN